MEKGKRQSKPSFSFFPIAFLQSASLFPRNYDNLPANAPLADPETPDMI
jgi:hypothetical protein